MEVTEWACRSREGWYRRGLIVCSVPPLRGQIQDQQESRPRRGCPWITALTTIHGKKRGVTLAVDSPNPEDQIVHLGGALAIRCLLSHMAEVMMAGLGNTRLTI